MIWIGILLLLLEVITLADEQIVKKETDWYVSMKQMEENTILQILCRDVIIEKGIDQILVPLKMYVTHPAKVGHGLVLWIYSIFNRKGMTLGTEFERADNTWIELINR